MRLQGYFLFLYPCGYSNVNASSNDMHPHPSRFMICLLRMNDRLTIIKEYPTQNKVVVYLQHKHEPQDILI